MERQYNLILNNDSVNSINSIIETITTVCNYTLIQSEQIAVLANCNGKTVLKENLPEKSAENYSDLFCQLGINVTIEESNVINN